MTLVDTHAHLNLSYYDGDRDEVVQRALAEGVVRIIDIGTDLETSWRAVALSQKYESVYIAVGLHPHHAKGLTSSALDELRKLGQEPKVVAIGEIGLDFYRNLSPREMQREAFRCQIQLAKELGLPIIVHNRQAHDEVRSILEGERAYEVGGVIHCFSGDLEMARWAVDHGFFLSFTGTITFKDSESLRVAKSMPLDSILLETDCPFMAPVPFRGRRNEPAYVKFVAQHLAQDGQLSLEEVAEATTGNAGRLFDLGL